MEQTTKINKSKLFTKKFVQNFLELSALLFAAIVVTTVSMFFINLSSNEAVILTFALWAFNISVWNWLKL